MVCKRRAPIFSILLFTSDANSATALMAASLNSKATFSAPKSAVYCLINADRGCVKILTKSSFVSLSISTRMGNRPCNSGIISDGVLT